MDPATIYTVIILIWLFIVEGTVTYFRRDMIAFTVGFLVVGIFLIFTSQFWFGLAAKIALGAG